MKTLNKILGIGLLTLTSLTGCIKSYNIDGKLVEYNKFTTTPIIVCTDSNKISYSTYDKYFSDPKADFPRHPYVGRNEISGKEIKGVNIAKSRKNILFPCRTVKYSYFPKRFSIYNPKDSAIINRERKNFDYYLSKIDSIERIK